MPYTSAVIVAAGGSTRLGQDKILLKKRGVPLICYTLRPFFEAQTVDEIIVVTRAESAKIIRQALPETDKPVIFTEGGACRQESVARGVAVIGQQSQYVCIHDGARPFISAEEIDNINRQAYQYNAVCCGVREVNTVKILDYDGFILNTLDRDRVVSIATPQVFSVSLYRDVLSRLDGHFLEFTDDAGMVEACGHRVRFVECSQKNRKVTTPEDLELLDKL